MGIFRKRPKIYPLGTKVYVPPQIDPHLGFGFIVDIANNLDNANGGTPANPTYLLQFQNDTWWVGQKEIEPYIVRER